MKNKDKNEEDKSVDTDEEVVHNEDMDDIVIEPDSEDMGDLSKAETKLKKLKNDLKICKKEKQEYLDGWQRDKADFINAKKEQEESKKQFISFAKEGILHDILPVADSFDMAFSNKEAWESVDKNWRNGVEYIYSQLISILENNGMKAINPMGEEFDPNKHSSIESIEVDKKEDDHKVVEVLQKGYSLNGKITRVAKVKVGKYKG